MFMNNWSKYNTEHFFALSLYKVGILDNLFFHFDRVRHLHSSLNSRIKIKSLWLGNNWEVCVNGKKVSQASIKLSLRQRSLSFKCVVWTRRLSPALVLLLLVRCAFPLRSVVPLLFKQRRRRRWWRRWWGQERSWSSASGWRRLTGSIWGSLCGPPPRSAGCPPRLRRSCERSTKDNPYKMD